MPLSHGGAIKLTTSRYFTPSGASIQGRGLVPDVLESGADVAAGADSERTRDRSPLAARDDEVRTALRTLKGEATHARPSAPTLTAHNFFP